VIVAGKTIQRSVQNINIGLQYFFKNTPKGRNPEDRYYKFYCFVAENPFNSFSIEVIKETENPYEFLKADQVALDISAADENCLNTVFDVHIPHFTQVNGKKSWINRGYYLNFMEWKKKRIVLQSKTV